MDDLGAHLYLVRGRAPFALGEYLETINKEAYSTQTMRAIHGSVAMNTSMQQKQDGPFGHSAEFTPEELWEQNNTVSLWLAFPQTSLRTRSYGTS